MCDFWVVCFFFQAEDGIRDFCLSRGLGDVYKRQMWLWWLPWWGEFVYKREGYKPVFDKDGYTVINEKYMTEDFMKRVMAHPDVIMREDLPWYDKDKHKLPDALSANLERIKSK